MCAKNLAQQSLVKVGCSRRKTVKRGKGTNGTLPRDATEHFVSTVHAGKHHALTSPRPPIASMPVRPASGATQHTPPVPGAPMSVHARLASSQLCSQLSAGVTPPSRAVKNTGLSGWTMRVAHVPCGAHSSWLGHTADLGGIIFFVFCCCGLVLGALFTTWARSRDSSLPSHRERQ